MENEPLFIQCECHGECYSAVLCGHLIHHNGKPLGIIENSNNPTNYQAWCFACEYLFQQENGMTDKFLQFNQMVVVCQHCYLEIKAKNNLQDDV